MVEMNGKTVFVKLRKKLLEGMIANRLKPYITDYTINKEYRVLEERRNEAGLIREGKVKEVKARLRTAVVARLNGGEWWHEGGGDLVKLLTGAGGVYAIRDAVIRVKIVTDMLATQVGSAHRGEDGDCAKCRLCGAADGGWETNYHVLWECPGDDGGTGKRVVDAREGMVRKAVTILIEMGLVKDGLAAASAVWKLKHGREKCVGGYGYYAPVR